MAEMTLMAEGRLTDVLGTIPGVSEVQIYGEQENEFRLQVFLPRPAGLGLDLGDVQAALRTLRADTALGDLETASQSVILRSRDPEVTVEMIENLRINKHIRIGGEETEILLQPGAAPVRNPQDIESVFMRTSGGKFVPRGTVALSMPRPAWERPPHGCRKSRPRCCRRMCASPCAARPPR